MNKFQSDVKTGGVNVDSSLKKTGTSMNALSATAKKAGAVIAGAFAFTAVLRGLRSFIFANADFEQSLAGLSAITGAVGNDLEYYKKQAIEMGAITTLSASQVSEAFMLVGSAQPELLKAKESLAQVTKEAITLAEAAGLQLPDAARALTGAMNQFKISADSASEVINVLAAGSKEGSADINSLNQ
ncbi:MAG TPA: phage tail tape measure protein, partial [Treponemataceae bacterium]|nr:phage tail tape measure protein [Treponemataceae bacterium]